MACTPHLSSWQTNLVRHIALVLALCNVGSATAWSAQCADAALGTSRVIEIGAATPPVGRKSFPATLPLADKEVVLTFDDGPLRGTTSRVLDVLGRQCVRATFFMVGRMAAEAPALVRRARAEGHTVAYHSFAHPQLPRMRPQAALADIDRGFSAVDAALGGDAPTPRFFRFPGFASSPALLKELAARGIVVFGTDVWASDWQRMSAATELHLVMARLKASHGGILLLHDTRRQTVAMLPALLQHLKADGFKIVHIVPAGAGATATVRSIGPPSRQRALAKRTTHRRFR